MKRGLVYAAIIVGILIAVSRRCDRAIDDRISSTVLAPADSGRVLVDTKRHVVTTVTRSGTKTEFLPPRTSSIVVGRDGSIKFQGRQYGTQADPFVGFAYSDKARVIIGVNLLYYHQWEGGLGVAPTMSGAFSVRLALIASYNVYSNTNLFVGITHTKEPIGGIAFRF